jgi:LPS sulfotransferase NodH
LALAILGRTDEALDHHRALTAAPLTRLRALARIAFLRPSAITAEELAEMRRAAEDGAIEPDLRTALFFAAGAVLEQAGDADAAFDAYAAGAALKCAILDWAGARTAAAAANEASVETLIRIFTPAVAAAPRPAGSMSPAPIFVVGMPRSGSTLIEQILAAHPEVQALGEIARLGEFLADDELAALRHGPKVKAIAEAYLDAARSLGWSGRGRFVDKTLENYLHVGAIARLFPRATILHSVRDPMDTCVSCFRQLFAAGNETLYDLADIGAEHRRYRRLIAHWRAVLPGRMIDVRYEALVADPDAGIRALVTEAAGLAWNDACLRFHARDRPVATASATQVRQPIHPYSVERWRRHADRLGPLIQALGEYGPRV